MGLIGLFAHKPQDPAQVALQLARYITNESSILGQDKQVIEDLLGDFSNDSSCPEPINSAVAQAEDIIDGLRQAIRTFEELDLSTLMASAERVVEIIVSRINEPFAEFDEKFHQVDNLCSTIRAKHSTMRIRDVEIRNHLLAAEARISARVKKLEQEAVARGYKLEKYKPFEGLVATEEQLAQLTLKEKTAVLNMDDELAGAFFLDQLPEKDQPYEHELAIRCKVLREGLPFIDVEKVRRTAVEDRENLPPLERKLYAIFEADKLKKTLVVQFREQGQRGEGVIETSRGNVQLDNRLLTKVNGNYQKAAAEFVNAAKQAMSHVEVDCVDVEDTIRRLKVAGLELKKKIQSKTNIFTQHIHVVFNKLKLDADATQAALAEHPIVWYPYSDLDINALERVLNNDDHETWRINGNQVEFEGLPAGDPDALTGPSADIFSDPRFHQLLNAKIINFIYQMRNLTVTQVTRDNGIANENTPEVLFRKKN